MELDDNAKEAVENLGSAINTAVEKSATVRDAIEQLRRIGFEPLLTLKLEIGLQEIDGREDGTHEHEDGGETELVLTDEDVQTLRRMKIKF